MQVDFAELRDHQEQPVVLFEFGDLLLEPEVLDDLTGTNGEGLDVLEEVGRDVFRPL